MNSSLLKKDARNNYKLLQAQQAVVKKAHEFIQELCDKPKNGDLKPAKVQEISEYAQLAIARSVNLHIFLQHLADLTFDIQHQEYGSTVQSLQQEIDLCFHECKSLHTIIRPLQGITPEIFIVLGGLLTTLAEQQTFFADITKQLEASCA